MNKPASTLSPNRLTRIAHARLASTSIASTPRLFALPLFALLLSFMMLGTCAAHARPAPEVPATATTAAWRMEQQGAVNLAREGAFSRAITILSDLYRAHSDDVPLTRDYLTVLGWANDHDDEVTHLYEKLWGQTQPDYVLDVVGRAYRNLKKTSEAAALYQRGLTQNPAKESFAVGLVRSLSESGYGDRALTTADDNLRRYGLRLEVIMAAADAALDSGKPDIALHYYRNALDIAPGHRDATHGYIIAADRAGWHRVAWESANNNPKALSAAEYRAIVGNDSAALIRNDMDNQPADHADTSSTDAALAQLDQQIASWQADDTSATTDLRRAQYDRVLALRNRGANDEALRSFAELKHQGVTTPDYVQSSAADALLAKREPEQARAMYQILVRNNPNDLELRRQLFYATMECGDYEEALLIADSFSRDKHAPDMITGSARLLTGQVAEADPLIRRAAAAAPNAPSSYEGIGNLAMAHGWPQAAYDSYKRGGASLMNQVGMADAALALQRYKEAEFRADDLIKRYPGSTHTQRVKRDWDIHNMAEFRLNAFYAPEALSGVNVTGGESHGIDATLYSVPFWKNWRVFAGNYYATQHEPNQEGHVSYTHGRAGVEYRGMGLTASAAPTFSDYNGTNRMGGEAEASYRLNDHWAIAGRGEIMSRDVPLRALNSGVTANQGLAKLMWHEDEARSVSVGAAYMPFSDGNQRSSGYASLVQRLLTASRYYIDGLLDAGTSVNSKDSNRSYYNPGMDATFLGGARVVHTLYQRYETLWQHSLRITPGAYWQRHYGTDGAVRARYEQRLFLNNTFEAGAGVNYARQSYDGNAEDDISASLDLVARF